MKQKPENIEEVDGGIRVFSTGSHYLNWLEHNCYDGCGRLPLDFYELQTDHADNCFIEASLCKASVGTGCITKEVYELMGKDTWKCTKFTRDLTVADKEKRQEQIKKYAKHQNDLFGVKIDVPQA